MMTLKRILVTFLSLLLASAPLIGCTGTKTADQTSDSNGATSSLSTADPSAATSPATATPSSTISPDSDDMAEAHALLSRQAATEGMVLLKNEDNLLPLQKNSTVAIFGAGQIDLIKGGTGSGDVTCEHVVGLLEGMEEKEQEGKISIVSSLADKYKENSGYTPTESVVSSAAGKADTAICIITRNSGEGADRSATKGDYYLSTGETRLIEKIISAGFENIVVVLNVGGIVDTTELLSYPEIKSILLAWQPGQNGGEAIADILVGDVTPSGKLSDTFAASYDDYPSSATFNESADYVRYTEDIFVGYRYFETFDPTYSKVNFEFGFGLSYTTFDLSDMTFTRDGEDMVVTVKVTNTGTYSGKEVVQVYFSAPQGLLGKPGKELCAFGKTRTLAPGESETLTMRFALSDMSGYDDTGKVQKSAYVLEAGDYLLYVGNSIRNAGESGVRYTYRVDETLITEQLSQQAAPTLLDERLLADGTYENLPNVSASVLAAQTADSGIAVQSGSSNPVLLSNTETDAIILFNDVCEDPSLMDAFLDQLTVEQLIFLLYGHGQGVPSGTGSIGGIYEFGIPAAETADGPAGVRLTTYTTAWPVETLLACTWNTELLYEVGEAVAAEATANKVDIWLAPGVNIHRNPLCGRNFEYFSEDPYLSGIMASALINGVQDNGIGVMIKHFVCNEKEYNRSSSDSRVSERALREIYLRPFEIAVKNANPWAIMSSYNKVNGTESAENDDLLTGILRGEWKYEGLVSSDWWNDSVQTKELLAGQSLKMWDGDPSGVLSSYKNGTLSRELLEEHAQRVIELIMKTKAVDRVNNPTPIVISKDVTAVIYGIDSLWRSDAIGIEVCEDENGTFNATNTYEGQWIIIPIDVKDAGKYTVTLRIASPGGSGGIVFYVDGEIVNIFTNTVNTGGWQNWSQARKTVTLTLPEGEHELKLAFTGGNFNINSLTFVFQ
ncbi:MAG: glycoside hydrolase family 3 C-terminal domain-containing protein [Eubacteriales bacterium]